MDSDNIVEIKLLQDTWIKVWQMYMTWFTWHFGINVAALGWALTSKDYRPQATIGALFMVLFASLTILVAMKKMRGFHMTTIARATALDLKLHEASFLVTDSTIRMHCHPDHKCDHPFRMGVCIRVASMVSGLATT